MDYVNHKIGESRVFDYIYDPNYILPSERDIFKANTYAMSLSAPIQIMTKYNLLFSNTEITERQIYSMDTSLFANLRQRAGECCCYNEEKAFNEVRGRLRPLYRYHPPMQTHRLTNVWRFEEHEEDFEKFGKSRTIGCQTIYRESSSQTQPYLPDAILRQGDPNDSDILAAAKYIIGYDDPCEFECQIIERARRKRQYEKSLANIKDAHTIQKYKTVLEAFEWEEWLAREKEIEEYQNMRMQIVLQLLEKRQKYFEDCSNKRIANTLKRIDDKRTKALTRLEHEHKRRLRKLQIKHKNTSMKYSKEDIVTAFADPTSELFAPKMRNGVNPNRRHFRPFREKFEERLDNLEKSVKEPFYIQCPFAHIGKLARPKPLPKEYTLGVCNEKYLATLYQSLKNLRELSFQSKSMPKCFRRKSKIQEITDTSTVVGVSEDCFAESDYQFVVYLQKIIKGRAIQNILFNSKNAFKGLIDEISSTYTLTAVKEMFASNLREESRQKYFLLAKQRRAEQIFKRENDIRQVLEGVEGAKIGWLFEFLEKELGRLNEKKKLQAICMLAEEERTKREAYEAGRRQMEEKRRQEYNEIYSQLTNEVRGNVTMYLEDALLADIDEKSAKDAREEIRALARHVDRAAEKSGKSSVKSAKSQDEGLLIGEMINDFVFPEVQKKIARHEKEVQRQKHLQAAQNALYPELDKLFPPTSSGLSACEIGAIFAREVITELIGDAISLGEEIPISPTDHPGNIETKRFVRDILSTVLPKKRWKTPSDRIVESCINDMLEDVYKVTTDMTDCRIDAILTDLYSKLVKHELITHSEDCGQETFPPYPCPVLSDGDLPAPSRKDKKKS